MKKFSCLLLSIALLFSFTAFAQGENESSDVVFGGTIELPSFNGLTTGLHMPIVLLAEENAGHSLQLLTYDSLSDVTPETVSIIYRCDSMTFMGESAQVYYVFRGNVLNRIYCTVQFSDQETASAFFDEALGMLTGIYGEYTDNKSGVFENDNQSANCLASYSNGPHFSWSEDVMPEHLDFNSDIELRETEEDGYTLILNLGGGYCYPANADSSSLSCFDARCFSLLLARICVIFSNIQPASMLAPSTTSGRSRA